MYNSLHFLQQSCSQCILRLFGEGIGQETNRNRVRGVGLLYPVECKKSRDQFAKQCRPTWVKHFDKQYASKKRLHRLLDDNELGRGPLSLPQPYTFKPTN
ncbi:hypothetical protein LOK49_LG03G03607 [Camellia lanceoleosa]|uniref:Uncharacterized protein n=1 Tax=Camellia lanceoleosa TaxID=1840588 RepID=A0ACC0I8K0_9ERIC|nr:hypothetical protein LOK49_LG03G03607 [Camellia lanceoleosa]